MKIRILRTGADGPLLAATFSVCKRDLTTGHLFTAFLASPLVTLKVIGAIHFEAARLWLKAQDCSSARRRSPKCERNMLA